MSKEPDIINLVSQHAVCMKLTSLIGMESERMENEILSKWNPKASRSSYIQIFQIRLQATVSQKR
jgi:hypothetical protein